MSSPRFFSTSDFSKEQRKEILYLFKKIVLQKLDEVELNPASNQTKTKLSNKSIKLFRLVLKN